MIFSNRARAVGTFLTVLTLVPVGGELRSGLFPVESGSYSLCAGTGRFLQSEFPSLRWVARSTEMVSYELASNGFESVLLTGEEVTRRRVVRELVRFRGSLKPRDRLVIYLAGQVVQGQFGDLYWVTYEASLPWLDSDAIRLDHLLEYIHQIPSERTLVLLDLTFLGEVRLVSNDFTAPSSRAPSSDLQLVAGRLAGQRIRRVIDGFRGAVIAAPPISSILADEGEGGASPFADSLVRALSSREADLDGAGDLRIGELADYLDSSWQQRTVGERLDAHEMPISRQSDGGTDWVLIDSLAHEQESTLARREFYFGKLRDWEVRGLIDFETLIESARVINAWVDSSESGASLAGTDEVLFEEVSDHLDAEGSEEILGPSLVTIVQRFAGKR